MIHRLAVILLLSVAPLHNLNAAVWAAKPIQCGTVEEVLKLVKTYGEEPFIYFDGATSRPEESGVPLPTKFVITRNKEKSSWTLIEIPHPEQACILGAGKSEITILNLGITT